MISFSRLYRAKMAKTYLSDSFIGIIDAYTRILTSYWLWWPWLSIIEKAIALPSFHTMSSVYTTQLIPEARHMKVLLLTRFMFVFLVYIPFGKIKGGVIPCFFRAWSLWLLRQRTRCHVAITINYWLVVRNLFYVSYLGKLPQLTFTCFRLHTLVYIIYIYIYIFTHIYI